MDRIRRQANIYYIFDIISNALVKMSDPNWLVCEGVESYSKYRMSIGYDVKNVVNVSLPPDSVHHSHFYELPRM